MKNPEEWGQLDSDILAHFLQVNGQLVKSCWFNTNESMSTRGGEVVDSSFPAFEDFVFAAVYFRQLTMEKDDLLNLAANLYRKFADSDAHSAWVYQEQQQFNAALDSSVFMIPGCSCRQLFDAFMYGASLMHKPPKLTSPKRALFLKIYDNEPRERVLFALNFAMKISLSHVSRIASVVYRDFGQWLNDHSLPKPDIRWHDRLFHTAN